MQSKGVKVIPTIAWGEPNTFWFCFDGVEKGSIVAVSTLGVRKEKSLFMQGYNEMLRKIKPEGIICYGEPFEEMNGNIIPIDYAETNNLKSKGNGNGVYIKKIIGYVVSHDEKGMGNALGEKTDENRSSTRESTESKPLENKLPKGDSQIKHIFRKGVGHMEDTPENRAMLENLVNNKENYKGTGSNELQWYSKIQTDNSQIWASVRNSIIQNGGINNPPKPWDPITGYSAPRRKFYIMDNSYEKRAYMSLYNIVEDFYWEKEDGYIAVLSGDMCPYLFKDSNSADPATYDDFINSLNACYAQSNKEDVFTAHKASIKFLEMYRDEFGFEIDEYIKKLTLDLYQKEFESIE